MRRDPWNDRLRTELLLLQAAELALPRPGNGADDLRDAMRLQILKLIDELKEPEVH